MNSSSPSRQLLWVGCGAACALGVWCLASATMAPTVEAHVRVQPPVATQTAMSLMQKPISRHYTSQARPTELAASHAPPVVTTAAGAAATPWLSWAAITVSAVAILVQLWRRNEQAPAPATVPAYQVPPVEVTELSGSDSMKMDKVALAIKADQARRKNLTPKQVILDLQRGNARFWSGTPERPEMSAMERRALIMAQAPTVCILSCADSRVPVEIVFDQGLGSIFVVRVAGNILDPTALGSIEFSVKYLGVKVILAMGHEACGAVKGAMSMSNEDLDKQPPYLQKVLKSIKGNLNVQQLKRIRDPRAQDREAVVSNTSAQVKALQENPLIASKINDGTVMVAGAFYEITSGIVDFFTLDKNGLVMDV